MLCKIFRCKPSELDEMNWDDVEYFSMIYLAAAKENPMLLFV